MELSVNMYRWFRETFSKLPEGTYMLDSHGVRRLHGTKHFLTASPFPRGMKLIVVKRNGVIEIERWGLRIEL